MVAQPWVWRKRCVLGCTTVTDQHSFLPAGSELLAQLQLLAPVAELASVHGKAFLQQQELQQQPLPQPQQPQQEPWQTQGTTAPATEVEAAAALRSRQPAQQVPGSAVGKEPALFGAAQRALPVDPCLAAGSAAELLNQLHVSATANQAQRAGQHQPAEVGRRPGLSTAELLEQLRASSSPAAPVQQLLQHSPAQVPGPSTGELLDQLRAACSGAASAQQRACEQGLRMPELPTAQLLEQLRASAVDTALQRCGSAALPQAAHDPVEQRVQAGHDGPVRTSAAKHAEAALAPAGTQPMPVSQQRQQVQHPAPDIGALIEQLRASAAPLAVGQLAASVHSLQAGQCGSQQHVQHAADQRALSTAELLMRLQQPAGPGAGQVSAGRAEGGSEDRAAELARLLAAAQGQPTAALVPPEPLSQALAADQRQTQFMAHPMPGQLGRQIDAQPAAAALRQASPLLQPPPPPRAASAAHDAELPQAKYRLQGCDDAKPAGARMGHHVADTLPQTEDLHASGRMASPSGSPASSAGSPLVADAEAVCPPAAAAGPPGPGSLGPRSPELAAAGSQARCPLGWLAGVCVAWRKGRSATLYAHGWVRWHEAEPHAPDASNAQTCRLLVCRLRTAAERCSQGCWQSSTPGLARRSSSGERRSNHRWLSATLPHLRLFPNCLAMGGPVNAACARLPGIRPVSPHAHVAE